MKLKFKHQQFQKDAAEDRAGDADRQYPSSTKASTIFHFACIRCKYYASMSD